LPKPGQNSITVKQQTYEVAVQKAKEEGYKSTAAFVTALINKKTRKRGANA